MSEQLFIIMDEQDEPVTGLMTGAEVDAWRRDWMEQHGKAWPDSGLRVWGADPPTRPAQAQLADLGHLFLAGLLTVARGLNEPDDVNDEYVRGQAELIMDACGLLPHEAYRNDVALAITHVITVERAVRLIGQTTANLAT
ncbi:MAG TPA: hypothetical protein VEF71_20030 [Streptosporangiaceae bacterium]|nr:hypothetical protein [Streptosporangiaceae bacterium]